MIILTKYFNSGEGNTYIIRKRTIIDGSVTFNV